MKKEDKELLFKITLAGAAYFAIVRPLLKKWGVVATPQQQQLNQANQTMVNNATSSMNDVCNITPSTKGDSLWLPIADGLYQLLHGVSIFNFNGSEVIDSINTNVQNDCDMLKLIVAFGNRENTAFLIPVGSGSLPEYITNVLSSGHVSDLNEILRNKGLTYQF